MLIPCDLPLHRTVTSDSRPCFSGPQILPPSQRLIDHVHPNDMPRQSTPIRGVSVRRTAPALALTVSQGDACAWVGAQDIGVAASYPRNRQTRLCSGVCLALAFDLFDLQPEKRCSPGARALARSLHLNFASCRADPKMPPENLFLGGAST